MATVRSVAERDKGCLLIMDDNSKPVWTPDRELALTLIGKPIPDDWTLKEGPFGPQAFPPRKGGGGGMAAWRNTKEGFEAEQAGRRRWQEIEEERRDRRTALMQAVAQAPANWHMAADAMYAWLRSSPAGGPPKSREAILDGVPTTEPAQAPQAGGSTSGEEADPSGGRVSRELGSSSGSTASDGGEVSGAGPGEGQSNASPGSTTDYPSDWPQDRPR